MKCRAWLTWGSQENYHAAALLLSSGLNKTVLLWQGQTAQVRTLQWSNEPALPDKRSLSVPGNLQPVSQSIPIRHCRQGPRSLQPVGCTEQLSCADFSLAGLDPRPQSPGVRNRPIGVLLLPSSAAARNSVSISAEAPEYGQDLALVCKLGPPDLSMSHARLKASTNRVRTRYVYDCHWLRRIGAGPLEVEPFGAAASACKPTRCGPTQ